MEKGQKMTKQERPIELLLVEDNESDIRLTQIALQQAKLKNRLHFVRDGEQALLFLRREGQFVDAPRPDLVLLDLNLPKVSGSEVLREIRADKKLKEIPVVVLSTSDANQDIYRSYELHANCYITKPVDLKKFTGVVETIEELWAKTANSPGKA